MLFLETLKHDSYYHSTNHNEVRWKIMLRSETLPEESRMKSIRLKKVGKEHDSFLKMKINVKTDLQVSRNKVFNRVNK